MKRLMRSYAYWYNMDRNIENLVKSYKGWALAAKAPPIKFNSWPETDHPWLRLLHIDFAMSLLSSSLLLQQCPACLVRLTWIVFHDEW